MTYTSILEKILLLINMISSSWIYISFIILNTIFIILLLCKKLSVKLTLLFSFLTTKLLLTYTIITNYKEVSSLISTITDDLFTNIYFPSAYTYLFILVTINIISIIFLVASKAPKTYKAISLTGSSIINFILILILEVISKNKIDIFAKQSLFTNTNLVSLLELSINIYILTLIGLSASFIINTVTERISIKRETKEPATSTIPANVVSNTLTIEEPVIIPEDTPTKKEEPVHAISGDNNYDYKFIPSFTATPEPIMNITPEVKPVMNIVPEINPVVEPTVIATAPEPTITYGYNFKEDTFDLSAFIPKKQPVKPINVIEQPSVENTLENTSTNINNNILLNQIINNELPVVTKEEDKQASLLEEKKNTYTLNDYRIFNKMLKDIREHNQSNSMIIDKDLEYRLITKYSTETFNRFKTMLKIYSN